VFPVLEGSLEISSELGRTAVEYLADSAGELLGAPEGTVGDVDVDRERLVELVVEDRTKRGEDTLESLDTAAKVETLLAALEEGLLDLSVLLRRPLAHDMVEEIDSVDAVSGPGSLTVQEGLEMNKIDLAGPAEMDDVLVTTSSGLGGTTLLLIEVDSNAEIPEVVGLSKALLDAVGLPNLLEEDALGVILCIAGVVNLDEVSGDQ
jgi:hypothetical protein